MVALPTNPPMTFGTDMDESPNVERVQFGDGYSQRDNPNINATSQTWNVQWQGISRADAEMLRLFFKGLRGTTLIEWTPFDQDEVLKFRATGFRSRPSGANQANCSVRLIQEFDL